MPTSQEIETIKEQLETVRAKAQVARERKEEIEKRLTDEKAPSREDLPGLITEMEAELDTLVGQAKEVLGNIANELSASN